MFRKLIYTTLLLQWLAHNVQAQGLLKKLGEKAANAGGDLMIKKGGQKAEKTIDGKPGEKTPQTSATNTGKDTTQPVPALPSKNKTTAYSRFDFVPGEQILLVDNFDQDVIGEFPLKWFTNGGGEVVTLEGHTGKWIKVNSGSILSPVTKLPENFTMEFDVLINLNLKSNAVFPGLRFEFFDRGDKAKRLDVYSYNLKNLLAFSTTFHYDKAVVSLDSRENNHVKLMSDKVYLPGFQSNYGNVVHVAVSVQKERLRLWYNAEKVLDLPTAVASPHDFNQLLINAGKTREGDPGFYLTNFKLAAGVPDMRSKLLAQGRFVTNGILFDINSDKVKPESYGIIREIASAIKEGNATKVKIIGHTDSDGSAETNLVLSKKRAAAVKEILTSEFGVDAELLSVDGKGSSQPIGSNSTPAGKAENRRVEFVKS